MMAGHLGEKANPPFTTMIVSKKRFDRLGLIVVFGNAFLDPKSHMDSTVIGINVEFGTVTNSGFQPNGTAGMSTAPPLF